MSRQRAAQRRRSLDKRLLPLLIEQPRHVLSIAIATGLAIAQGLLRAKQQKLIDRLAHDEAFCFAACEATLELWAEAARAGALSEPQFDALVNRIVAMAVAS